MESPYKLCMVGGWILLSAVRSYGMDVTPNMALDMYRILHLTIFYQQKDEWKDLESKFLG